MPKVPEIEIHEFRLKREPNV